MDVRLKTRNCRESNDSRKDDINSTAENDNGFDKEQRCQQKLCYDNGDVVDVDGDDGDNVDVVNVDDGDEDRAAVR